MRTPVTDTVANDIAVLIVPDHSILQFLAVPGLLTMESAAEFNTGCSRMLQAQLVDNKERAMRDTVVVQPLQALVIVLEDLPVARPI